MAENTTGAVTAAEAENTTGVDAEHTRGIRKRLVGVVTSDKMDKTIVVTVTTLKQHPLYKRTMKRSKKFKAHDENNECNEGDTVEIMESRPLSREKRWRLVRVVERAK